jgi:GNAT superfamily N-acetyltransferase
MSADFEFRSYEPGDEKGIVQLLDEVFDGWPHFDLSCSAVDHWSWKYLDNPTDVPFIRLTSSGARIVACLHSVLLRVKIGSKVVSGRIVADNATHPEFRKQGITRKMMRAARRPMGVSYFVSVSHIWVPRFSEAGLRLSGVRTFVRIHEVSRQLAAMEVERPNLMRLGFLAAKVVGSLRNAVVRRPTASQDLELREIGAFDDEIDGFWEEIVGEYDFIVERRRDFLNWRYCDPRSGGYVVMQAEEAGRVVGYSVLKINRYVPEHPTAFLCDLIALPGRRDVLDALVADAVRRCDGVGVNMACCAVPKGHPSERALARHGFLNSRMELPIFFGVQHWKDPEISDLIRSIPPGRVHFSFGDLDTLPVAVPKHR